MKIGLLPLYIKLYDDKGISRTKLEAFYTEIVDNFKNKNMDVVTNDFCRIKEEFSSAIKKFENDNVDAIVTLHMAYSPSLEAIDILAKTQLPIIVLDSTPALEFTNEQDPSEINSCHGIHGVMDLCSMLMRRGKRYAIAAGHFKESDVIDRVCGFVKLAASAKALDGLKVGLIGGAFDGMGDFIVPYEEMKSKFGIDVVSVDSDTLKKYQKAITKTEVEAEAIANKEFFNFKDEADEDYEATLRACLTLRKCIEGENLSAFSVNFLKAGKDGELDSMPFIECCKAMSRGVGYAGEGDALTAALMGAIVKTCPDTSFVEIFCPDWKNNMVFLSHMGEMNYYVAAKKPCIQKNAGKFTNGKKPFIGYASFKGGKGCYVNLSRDKDNYKLVISEAEMVEYDKDNFGGSMRGWMKTKDSTAEFLEKLSKNGATHHSIFTYGAKAEAFEFFGKLLNIETVII